MDHTETQQKRIMYKNIYTKIVHINPFDQQYNYTNDKQQEEFIQNNYVKTINYHININVSSTNIEEWYGGKYDVKKNKRKINGNRVRIYV